VEAAFRALVFMACEFSYDPEASKPKNLDDPFNDARAQERAETSSRARPSAQKASRRNSRHGGILAPLGMQKARPRP
jgi:hypothetical protein